MQKFSVAFVQISRNPLSMGFYRLFQLQKGFLAQHGAVHVPSPLHQIVGFIHQKNIFSPDSLRKKAAQIDMGIKKIIVIADYRIGKQTHIKTQLKGADLMLLCIRLYLLSGEIIHMGQQVVHSVVDSVIVSLSIGTEYRITLDFRHSGRVGFFPAHKTDFVLGSQYDAFKL